MTRRFSPELLYALRNEIPIDILAEKWLSIPCERSGPIGSRGRFRFACPLCGGFETSVLWEKNLGRCFQCNKNFNTIDLVMHCMNIDFVESVNRLQTYRSGMTLPDHCDKPPERKKTKSFVPIGKIIADILPDRPDIPAEREKSVDENRVLSARMDDLETKIENLCLRVEKLCNALIAE